MKRTVIQSENLDQKAYQIIKDMIENRELLPGQKIPQEKLAAELGISRTPLREALHKLEREDWIEKIPSGGFQVVTLTKEDIEQTFGIRSVLEAYAARLAAENHKEKDLVPLEKKIMEFQACIETNNSNKLQKINTEFHDLLYGLSKSPKLIKMINQLRAQISRFRQIILKQDGYANESNEDHLKMLAAIKKRDTDAVEQLVRAHILKGKTAVLSQFSGEGKEKISA
jgi:DNA-binding GntR family transcriptional regulator